MKQQRESKYWKNKPVSQLNSFVYNSSRIENLVETEQSFLPEPMAFNVIKISDANNINVVCTFLQKYYQEKNSIVFTANLLKFVLGEKGEVLTIINKKNNAVCGVVCVGFKNVVILDKIENFAFVNFLCAHPVYRKKGIAETLINELIRYVKTEHNIQQGSFLSKEKLFRQCSVIRKYQRPLNYNKLYETEFFVIEDDTQNKEKNKEKKVLTLHKRFLVEDDTYSDNYIKMEREHVNKVFELYNNYMSQYNISCKYTQKELENLLLDTDFVKSYVILDDTKNIVDFTSYCVIQYLGKDNVVVNAGHVFLYSLLKEYGDSMMNNLVKIMNKNKIDIVYTNDDTGMSDNLITEKYDSEEKCENSDIETYEKVYEHKFLKKQKLYLNLFNWECPFLTPEKVSLFFI